MIVQRIQSNKTLASQAANELSLRRSPKQFRGIRRSSLTLTATAALALVFLAAPAAPAQDQLTGMISVDASTFAVSANNRIVFAVPHTRRKNRTIVEHDEITIADFRGHQKPIVEPDRFMPDLPPVSYVVKKLAWSPDGKRIAATMMVFTPTAEPQRETEKQLAKRERREEKQKQKEEENAPEVSLPANGTQVVAFFDDDGHEIRVSGSKARFIEQASNGAWLADGQTAVYLAGIGPYKIARVTPADGKTTILFGGAIFDQVVWDTARNQAFALGRSLSVSGRTSLLQLDLLHETVQQVARVPDFKGELTVSASGQQVGYYVDGDTVAIHNLANPLTPLRLRIGPGKFGFGPDGQRILLKRGSLGDSGDLIWIGLHDDSWVPILHDLPFHDFTIAPDGSAIVVMDPGRGVLKIYRL